MENNCDKQFEIAENIRKYIRNIKSKKQENMNACVWSYSKAPGHCWALRKYLYLTIKVWILEPFKVSSLTYHQS